ncbi:MAG: hypothetical protein WCX28_03545 [Bacteriovoracaceae bacterium]|nr:hypothetical protein [Bacteroidota bacterium]
MIPLIIFYLHIVGVTAAFTSEYQKEGISAGALNVGFVILIFSVGWSISTFILKYLMDAEGFGMWLNRDALSLVVLTVGEAVFYYFYFSESPKQLPQH